MGITIRFVEACSETKSTTAETPLNERTSLRTPAMPSYLMSLWNSENPWLIPRSSKRIVLFLMQMMSHSTAPKGK
jgi:hypothetical protein